MKGSFTLQNAYFQAFSPLLELSTYSHSIHLTPSFSTTSYFTYIKIQVLKFPLLSKANPSTLPQLFKDRPRSIRYIYPCPTASPMNRNSPPTLLPYLSKHQHSDRLEILSSLKQPRISDSPGPYSCHPLYSPIQQSSPKEVLHAMGIIFILNFHSFVTDNWSHTKHRNLEKPPFL